MVLLRPKLVLLNLLNFIYENDAGLPSILKRKAENVFRVSKNLIY